MSEQEQQSIKDELLNLMEKSIKHIKTLPDEQIEKRLTKLNTENSIGYYVSDNKVHLWIVDLPEK